MKHKLSLITLLLAGTLNLFASDDLGSGSRSNSLDSIGSIEGRRTLINKSIIADPKIDYSFKQVFSEEKFAKPIIQYILQARTRCNIEGLTLTLQNNEKQFNPESKKTITDVKWKCSYKTKSIPSAKNTIIIEMQNQNIDSFDKRIQYYGMQEVSSQLAASERYSALCPVLSIAFLNYKKYTVEDIFYTAVDMISYSGLTFPTDISGINRDPKYTNLLSCIYIIIPNITSDKLAKLEQSSVTAEVQDELKIMNLQDNEPVTSALGDNLLETLKDIRNTQEYITALKASKDAQGRNIAAREEGIAIGMEKGKMEGKLETAKKMLARKMLIDDIAAITGLSVKDITGVPEEEVEQRRSQKRSSNASNDNSTKKKTKKPRR